MNDAFPLAGLLALLLVACAAALDVLKEQNISDARVRLTDRGALDCVIRARVETAVARAKGE